MCSHAPPHIPGNCPGIIPKPDGFKLPLPRSPVTGDPMMTEEFFTALMAESCGDSVPEPPTWQSRADQIHRAYVDGKWEAYGDKDILFLALSLGGETGEALNDVKKWMRDDVPRDEFVRRVGKELADVRILVELTAKAVGVDLDAACVSKLEEVAARPEVASKLKPESRDPAVLRPSRIRDLEANTDWQSEEIDHLRATLIAVRQEGRRELDAMIEQFVKDCAGSPTSAMIAKELTNRIAALQAT